MNQSPSQNAKGTNLRDSDNLDFSKVGTSVSSEASVAMDDRSS